MAALNFPTNPSDGQLYPDPPIPGSIQYIFSTTKGTWLTVSQGVGQVRGEAPVVIKGTRQIPIVTMPPVSQTQDGYMTAADKKRLDETVGGVRAITAGLGLGAPSTGNTITDTGTINLLPASGNVIGGVRPGASMTVDQAGTLENKVATTTYAGIVRPGAGLRIATDGTLTTTGGLVVLRDISPGFNGISTSFTLQRLDGSPYIPTAANQLMIFVGGVIQIPGNGFGVNSSQIVFTSAPPTGATFYGVAIT